MTTTLQVKEKPILFRGDLVRAILEGRKTMTRRPIKAPLKIELTDPVRSEIPIGPIMTALPGAYRVTMNPQGAISVQTPEGMLGIKPGEFKWLCPFGQPGDRLWVRETWRVGAWNENDGEIAVDYKADGFCKRQWLRVENDDEFERLWIQSSDDAEKAGRTLDPDIGEDGGYKWEPGDSPCRWRPSIHMPRWASRITLEITNVRVERIREIRDVDAQEEGYEQPDVRAAIAAREPISPSGRFVDSWRKTYPGSWDRNDWVWVIEFKRISPEENHV